MAIEVFCRYEIKYLMDFNTWNKLQILLLEYMKLDEYNKDNKFYTINNIYYDTCDNDIIRKCILKPKYREKLRLRSYGTPTLNDLVYLEIKKKVNGLVNKRRTALTLNEAYEFVELKNNLNYENYMNKQVLNEIEYFLNFYSLEPKIFISYNRRGFFSTTDRDLRITFDKNIRTRRNDLRLEYGNFGQKVLNQDIYLVEIKTIKALPLWLSKMLSMHKLYSVGFSKYGTEYKTTKSTPNIYKEVSYNA